MLSDPLLLANVILKCHELVYMLWVIIDEHNWERYKSLLTKLKKNP